MPQCRYALILTAIARHNTPLRTNLLVLITHLLNINVLRAFQLASISVPAYYPSLDGSLVVT